MFPLSFHFLSDERSFQSRQHRWRNQQWQHPETCKFVLHFFTPKFYDSFWLKTLKFDQWSIRVRSYSLSLGIDRHSMTLLWTLHKDASMNAPSEFYLHYKTLILILTLTPCLFWSLLFPSHTHTHRVWLCTTWRCLQRNYAALATVIWPSRHSI